MTEQIAFFEYVCQNYKDETIDIKFNIGYSHTNLPFLILPSFALMLNLFIIVTHIRKEMHAR